MIKNALAYVSRKKNRTLIIFIILTIVLSFLYSCLSIMKSNEGLEKSLYKYSNSSLSITKKDNGYFETEKFKEVKRIKEVKELTYEYNGLAKPLNAKVVTGKQKIERDNLPDEFNNILSLEATNNTKRNVLFTSGVFTIKKGRGISENDRNKILVHEDFAKKNNLKLNDKIGLNLLDNNNMAQEKEEKYEIIGIFSGKKQEKYTGLSSDFSENSVFTDYESLEKALFDGKAGLTNKINIYTDNPENIKTAFNKIKNINIDWSKYNLEKDTGAFEEIINSLSGIKHLIKIIAYSIAIGGLVVISLILILWLRERIYEIGILLSIGISKAKIISQFIIELIIISIPAFLSSLILGNLILKQLTGRLIESGSGGDLNIDIIKNQSLLDSITTFLQSYGILISIIIISVALASSMILIKKPKDILSKIS